MLRQVPPILSPQQQDHLRVLAQQGCPNEVCGVVYEHDIIVQYTNVSPTPDKNFDAEIDLEGVKAIWHSHPNGPSHFSDDDLKFIGHCEAHGFRFRHILVLLDEVKEFEVLSDTATPAA